LAKRLVAVSIGSDFLGDPSRTPNRLFWSWGLLSHRHPNNSHAKNSDSYQVHTF